MQNREEVFDWATTDWPDQHTQAPAIYQPQTLAPATQAALAQQFMQQPMLTVRQTPQGIPVYVQEIPAASLPAHDPLPQRMAGAGILLAGAGVFSVCLGAGSLLFFKGLSMADHALVALAIVFVSGAISFFIAKAGTGVRVSNVRIGNNSSFNVGGKR